MPMPESPWGQAQKVFQGVRFDVYALSLPAQDQGTQRREVVVPADAVVILPLLDEQTVVMIRNQRFAVNQTLWELPAGTLEPGEDPALCAARELEEETGYTARTITPLIEFYTTPGFCTEKMSAFCARGLTLVGQRLDPTERIDVEPVPITQAIKMIRDNQIRDAKTIAALLFHLHLGGQQS